MELSEPVSEEEQEFPSIEDTRGRIESDLFPRLVTFIETPMLADHRLHQLAKDITRFVWSTLREPEDRFDAQRKELAALQVSIGRTLSSLKKINSSNKNGDCILDKPKRILDK